MFVLLFLEISFLTVCDSLLHNEVLSNGGRVIQADTSFPERQEFHTHYVPDIEVDLGDNSVEYIDNLRIKVPLLDVRDFKKYKALNILGGRALLVSVPAVHCFLKNHHEKMFSKVTNRCQTSEKAYAVDMNRIADDPARDVITHLIVYSGGMYCSAKKDDYDPPGSEQAVKLKIIEGESDTIRIKGVTKNLTFFAGAWTLRVVAKERKIIKKGSKKDEDDLAECFGDMGMGASS